MSLSLTCACGARLEVDDKFAGQVITCPDCNRPLTAPLPERSPTRTSGLALAAFILALVGAVSVIGTVAAIGCGLLALRKIKRSAEPIGGKNFARAAVILGSVFTLLTLAAFLSMERLGLDGFLRSLQMAGSVELDQELTLQIGSPMGGSRGFSLQRPSRTWGKLKSNQNAPPIGREDLLELTLINVWRDAQIVCLADSIPHKFDAREEAMAMLQMSRLMKMLARLPAHDPGPALDSVYDLKQLPDSETEEFYLDARLGGIDRTFLVRVLRDGPRVAVVAGGTRKNRFAKLEPQLREGVESFKWSK
jgi:hypothetical protein